MCLSELQKFTCKKLITYKGNAAIKHCLHRNVYDLQRQDCIKSVCFPEVYLLKVYDSNKAFCRGKYDLQSTCCNIALVKIRFPCWIVYGSKR